MNENAAEWPLTRRQALAAGFAAAVGLIVGCGSATHAGAGWTFVDDRKHTVRLRKRPTRIVAYTTAAAALHQWGATPVGVFGDNPHQDRTRRRPNRHTPRP
jgi:iron complex transport system substrate-binding protein